MPKSRAQFTPMRTTAADSRTKVFITLDTNRICYPLFDKPAHDFLACLLLFHWNNIYI
jgi:hypothetical protein